MIMELVFCYQHCFDLLWQKNVLVIQKKILKIEAEGWEFAKILKLLEQIIWTVKFVRFDKLEQLEFILEKNYWDSETCRKS